MGVTQWYAVDIYVWTSIFDRLLVEFLRAKHLTT